MLIVASLNRYLPGSNEEALVVGSLVSSERKPKLPMVSLFRCCSSSAKELLTICKVSLTKFYLYHLDRLQHLLSVHRRLQRN